MHLLYKYVLQKTIQKMLFLIITIGDRYGGQISVPGAQVCELLFFFQLYCILINTKKPESSFLELSDFFTGDTYRASSDTLRATVPVPMALPLLTRLPTTAKD